MHVMMYLRYSSLSFLVLPLANWKGVLDMTLTQEFQAVRVRVADKYQFAKFKPRGPRHMLPWHWEKPWVHRSGQVRKGKEIPKWVPLQSKALTACSQKNNWQHTVITDSKKELRGGQGDSTLYTLDLKHKELRVQAWPSLLVLLGKTLWHRRRRHLV